MEEKIRIILMVFEFIFIILMGISVMFLKNELLLLYQGFLYIGTVIAEKKIE